MLGRLVRAWEFRHTHTNTPRAILRQNVACTHHLSSVASNILDFFNRSFGHEGHVGGASITTCPVTLSLTAVVFA